jgi:hypothetical protein
MRLMKLCGCDELLCLGCYVNSFSHWSQFGIFTQFIYKIPTSSVLIGYAFLQIAYNLHRGHGIENEEPPPPTPAKLMQTVVEGQRLLADAMR